MSIASEKLAELSAKFSEEHDKFETGVAAAGTRARKVLQEIKAFAQDIRKEIQNKKNNN